MADSNRIRVLPERLANKIAAGEVVERPASVVKELVENAIDAGAKVVRVESEAGGRRLIRVTDDGTGMTPDDALLALERHATSKIATDDDLFSIHTLGFRGEALPSIASVSRFELLTRAHDRDEGVRIRVEGGSLEGVEPAGCAPGTVVTVRNLFFNVPARLKFLRSQTTELGHITDVVSRIAIAHPSVHFQLLHDGHDVIETPPAADHSGRIADALGTGTLDKMREVRLDIDDGHRIHGYTSLPDLNRSSSANIYTYVNGRFIRDRMTNHAIIEAYRGFLPKDRYPIVVLFIEVPPEEVDVNVHPTKAEVRFREGQRIHDLIRQAVLGAFERKPDNGGIYSRGRPPSLPQHREHQPGQPQGVAPTDDSQQSVRRSLLKAVENMDTPQPVNQTPQPDFFHRPATRQSAQVPSAFRPPASALTPVTEPKEEGYFSSLEILGQLRNTYVVCQSPDGLTLIDQHAAHERTAFERLKRDYAARRIQRQSLLFPDTLELGLKEAREMNRLLDTIASLGFEIEAFGGKSFLIRALPAILGNAEPKAIVMDLLETLSEMRSPDSLNDRLDEVFARLSCHAVIRAGRSLSVEEMQALMKSLDEADYPLTCPHGRPICVRISYDELERMFGRR